MNILEQRQLLHKWDAPKTASGRAPGVPSPFGRVQAELFGQRLE
jgi:hypothetical protein